MKNLFLYFCIVCFFNSAQIIFAQKNLGYKNFDVFSPSTQTAEASLRTLATDVEILNVNSSILQQIQTEQPTFIRFQIVHQTDTLVVKMQRHEIFSDDFVVRNQDDELLNYTPGLYYRGIVNEERNSLAVFNFFDESVNGVISEIGKGNRVVGQVKNRSQYVVYSDTSMTVSSSFVCQVDEMEQVEDLLPQQPYSTSSTELTTNCVKKFYELTNDIYVANFSDVDLTLDWLTSVHNIVAALYTDAGVQTALSDVLIWQEEDPYVGDNLEKLIFFRENRFSFNGDLAHLLDLPVTGGVAYLNSLCTPFRHGFSGLELFYNELPTYSWTINVIAHEMGHSLGSPHTHACFWNGDDTAIDGCGPQADYSEGCDDGPIPFLGGTIMSYCHLLSTGVNLANGFHPQVAAHMANTVDTKNCLGQDCINSCMQTVAGLAINQTEDTSFTIQIEDVVSDSWDYLVWRENSFPGFTTVSTNSIDYAPVLPNQYFQVRVYNNCTVNEIIDFVTVNYLSDADWCTDVSFNEPWYNQFNIFKNFTKTFYPNASNQLLSLTINEFDLENEQNFMTIYDGENTAAPVFENGENLTGSLLENTFFEATNPAGAITIAYFADFPSNSSTWDISFSCETLSVNRFTDNEVVITPNPFNSILNIESELALDEIIVYNLQGKIIHQQSIEQTMQYALDLSHLNAGVYFAKLRSGEATTIQRIIKK